MRALPVSEAIRMTGRHCLLSLPQRAPIRLSHGPALTQVGISICHAFLAQHVVDFRHGIFDMQ